MKKLEVNATPVRTSERYLMNSFLVEAPTMQKVSSFAHYVLEDFDQQNIILSEAICNATFAYGNGKELEQQVQEKANVKMKITMTGNTEKENVIHFTLDEKNTTLIEKIEIEVQENCHGSVTIRYDSDYTMKGKIIDDFSQEKKGYHNGFIFVTLHPHATLQCNVVNLLEENVSNFLSIENHLEEKAVLQNHIVDFGGDNSITNYYTELSGDMAENEINTIYLGDKKQKKDMNYIIVTRGKKAKVQMDVQGALIEEAKKHFKGTIDFKRGSQKTVGSENEFCMLLSDQAKSISLPMLLCEEEDVVGNHAAAAGKVNFGELFYLMSRGLTEKEARALLVKARFQKVIDAFSNKKLRKEIVNGIQEKLEISEKERES